MGKAVVVTSGKGGTGKSTISGAVSACLAESGFRTLCLDADIELKNLDLILGLSDYGVYDFMDILDGRCSLSSAITAHPAVSNLFFLTAPSHTAPSDIDPDKFYGLIAEIKSCFDYCIIDSPAGLGASFKLAVGAADSAIVVATADVSSYRDAQRAVIELLNIGKTDISLVVNRVRPRLLRYTRSNIDDIVDAVGARLLGLVPEDRAVILAANSGTPLVAFSSRGALPALRRISARLTGKRVPVKLIRKTS